MCAIHINQSAFVNRSRIGVCKQENIVYDDYYKHSIYFADEKGCTDIETKVKTKQNNTNRIIKRSNTIDTNTYGQKLVFNIIKTIIHNI